MTPQEPDFTLKDVSEEDYDAAGSKFITLPPGAKKGDVVYRLVEIGLLDWDTPGKSLKIPVTVTDKMDNGKEDKLSFGISKDAMFKGKDAYKAITGKDMPIVNGHPKPSRSELSGKSVYGIWTVQIGKKGGAPDGDEFLMAKLTGFLPAGVTPSKQDSLGI